MAFVGRTKELEILEGIRNRNGVKTCMIYGKRRHGKSELIKHFCENRRSLRFEFTLGSLESQLEYMTDVISVARDKQIDTYRTVYSCLRDVVQFCRESETIVVFDEFQYLANDDDAVSFHIGYLLAFRDEYQGEEAEDGGEDETLEQRIECGIHAVDQRDAGGQQHEDGVQGEN